MAHLENDKINDTVVKNDNYHVRAGRIGGQTTKKRHHSSNFFKEIGSKGGSSTMHRHGEIFQELRKKGGNTTRERYGEQYYQEIAAKAARVKQGATQLRNEAIKAFLAEGIKIPTIIKLTLNELSCNPRYRKFLLEGPVAQYLQKRPAVDNQFLFVSQSGKPLSLANTYTVMSRHKS